jgi:homocysteine S-methyltransferase
MSSDFFGHLATKKYLILDAALGTEIQKRGGNVSPPLWSARILMDNPSLLMDIHLDHLEAGADILTANTFRTQGYLLEKCHLQERAFSLTALALKQAQKARTRSGKKAWIFGSMAPLEDCYEPEKNPPWQKNFQAHRAHVRNLKAAGADALILETFSHPREIKAAFQAARESGLPVILSLTCLPEGRSLAGVPLKTLVPWVENECGQPDFWGLNCMAPQDITSVHRKLKKITSRPTALWAQVGYHDGNSWKHSGLMNADAYAREAKKWLHDGARIIGSCCGTDARFTRALKEISFS